MICRHCKIEASQVMCNLQTCPPSNAMVKKEFLNHSEKHFPLTVFVCNNCWLVQVDEIEKAEDIFNNEYTYFSSFSTSWLKHAKAYTDYMVDRFKYTDKSLVLEIASNDGYLLQYFKEKNIPVLGAEPTANTAKVAIDKGIHTIVDFFNSKFANKYLTIKPNLILGNNVLAHVPDINDFVSGVKNALNESGVVTFEFPHLCKLMQFNQFDTIYHEHFSYLSLTAVKSIFEKQGLDIFDVQELNTHGGSIRIFAKHKNDASKTCENSVNQMLDYESKIGVKNQNYYELFQTTVEKIKDDFIEFLLNAKKANKKVVGYGAAAKGNTLLNYCGIKGTDLISFVVDASPFKQGKYLPGSRIPVLSESALKEFEPDYVIIFPWNLKTEISEQLKYINNWNGKFVMAIPELTIQ